MLSEKTKLILSVVIKRHLEIHGQNCILQTNPEIFMGVLKQHPDRKMVNEMFENEEELEQFMAGLLGHC